VSNLGRSSGRGGLPRSTMESQTEVPRDFPSVPPPTTPMLDHSFTLQAIMELQKSLAELSAKTDRLIKDVESHSSKIDGVRHQITFVKGALWVVGGLVVIVGAVATWYVTGKISISLKP
jgi:hypothetical protein